MMEETRQDEWRTIFLKKSIDSGFGFSWEDKS